MFFADIVLVLLGLFVATQLRILLPLGGHFVLIHAKLPLTVYLFAVICWSVSLVLVEAYNPQKVLRAVDEIRRVFMASFQSTLIMAGMLYLTYREVSRYQFIYFYLTTTFLILFYRGILRVYYRIFGKGREVEPRRIIVVGAGDLGIKVAEIILQHRRWGFDFIGFLDDDLAKQGWQPEGLEGKTVLGTVDQLIETVREYEVSEIYLALPSRAFTRLRNIVATLQMEAVNIRVVPDYYSLALVNARFDIMGGLPTISLRAPVIEGMNRLIKQIFDLIVSLLLLLVLWPVLVFIAVLIRRDSPGPALFKQQRVGENGQLFTMYKFRTMVLDAEDRQEEVIRQDDDGNVIHKHPDDPRLTRFGKFLRSTSLDELPQLFNVLKGDMSLVGPRPELPWLVEKYQPWQRKRFAVPQGITGWWQVNKREYQVMHMSTEDDLYYVYNYSLWLDIKILFMTFGALFRGF